MANEQVPKHISAAAISHGYDGPKNLALLIPAVVNNALGVPDAFQGVPGATPALAEAPLKAFREAYAVAFQRMFYATIPFGLIAVICACFIKDPSKYLTNHTAVHMQRENEGRHDFMAWSGKDEIMSKKDTVSGDHTVYVTNSSREIKEGGTD